jgi:hypothetical protein
MPYVHWESGQGYESMRRAVDGPTVELQRDICTAFEVTQSSVSRLDPQHVRRTLDQSYYATLRDTSERDEDQVVQRYARDKSQTVGNACPMLMVDQCWLWVIGDGNSWAWKFQI